MGQKQNCDIIYIRKMVKNDKIKDVNWIYN